MANVALRFGCTKQSKKVSPNLAYTLCLIDAQTSQEGIKCTKPKKYLRAYYSIVNCALTRRYDVENTWPLLVSNLIGGPTAESAIIDFVFRRVAGHTLGTVREKLLGGKRGKVS